MILYQAGDWKDFAKRARTETDRRKATCARTNDLRTMARAEAGQERNPVTHKSPL
jgi:hypothetical protein